MIAVIPIRLPSAANLREHWRVRHRRTKEQRNLVTMFLGKPTHPALPVTVRLTRIAPRALDGDNLQSAFKAIRDSVASWLGVDDADERVVWKYAQAKGGAKRYAIEIEVVAVVAVATESRE